MYYRWMWVVMWLEQSVEGDGSLQGAAGEILPDF